MHVHREGGLDVALNNCIGAREGRRKSDVTSRLFHLTFRLARPLIARDRSSRQAFVLRRTCYAFQRCSCLLVIRIYARVDRIKGFVFKGCSLWTILYWNENVTIRYFIEKSDFNEKLCAIYFSLLVNQIFRIVIFCFLQQDNEALIIS